MSEPVPMKRRRILLAWRALGPVDMRSIGRDSLLAPMLLVPFLVWALLRFGLPPLAQWLELQTGFDLRPVFPLLVGYAGLAMVPIIFAMIAGFLLLDERDAGTSRAIAVTPLSARSYIAYRTGLPFLASVISALVLIPATGMIAVPPLALLLAVLLGACGAPLYALALAALADDKVQGMAVIKVMSAAQILPVVSFFFPSPWHWAGAVIPSYWPLYALLGAADRGLDFAFELRMAVGAVFHGVLLIWLVSRMQRILRR